MFITKKIILDYDDFHWKCPENCLDTVYKFIEKIPNIKINFFTSPNYENNLLSNNSNWCNEVRTLINSNNIRLCVHGWNHIGEEFKNVSLDKALALINASENEFKKCNLSFSKVFKGPRWGINQNTYDALKLLNYTHIYTHEDYKHLIEINDIKSVIYNWNLKDDPCDNNVLYCHGHSWSVCANGISETFNKVISFIEKNNVEFKFCEEE